MYKKLVIFSLIILPLAALLIFVFYRYYSVPEKCNAVIIVSDALRADVPGCYGGDAKTPNIDWLARHGVLFENAHSTSASTAPSAISMFTGKYPNIFRKGTINWGKMEMPAFYVPDSDLMLAEVLKDSGYKVKKDCENKQAFFFQNMQGFEEIKAFSELTKQEKTYIEDITGIKPELKYCRSMYGFLNSLLSASEDRPFFLVKWILDPHSPYNPPAKFKKRINVDPSKLSREIDFYSKLQFIGTPIIKKGNEYEQNYLQELYKKEVEFVDERIGFILRALKHKDLFDSTYVIFTSDHGEMFGEHGQWCHGQNYYEELVRVPLIITGPGISKREREKTIVSLLDLMPTLKDLLGIKYEDNSQGKSFAGLLTQDPVNNENFAYFVQLNSDTTKFQDALLENNNKLIVLKDDTCELYNLNDDPEESNDISKENPELVGRMLKKAERIRKENRIRAKENSRKVADQVSEDNRIDKAEKEAFINQLRSLGYLR